MKIGDYCIFNGTKGPVKCEILDIKQEFGPSIKNDALETMDLKFNTYYKVEYFSEVIWVSAGFLELCESQN